jgi:hypothetical protein
MEQVNEELIRYRKIQKTILKQIQTQSLTEDKKNTILTNMLETKKEQARSRVEPRIEPITISK